jgi:hypothetical protein
MPSQFLTGLQLLSLSLTCAYFQGHLARNLSVPSRIEWLQSRAYAHLPLPRVNRLNVRDAYWFNTNPEINSFLRARWRHEECLIYGKDFRAPHIVIKSPEDHYELLSSPVMSSSRKPRFWKPKLARRRKLCLIADGTLCLKARDLEDVRLTWEESQVGRLAYVAQCAEEWCQRRYFHQLLESYCWILLRPRFRPGRWMTLVLSVVLQIVLAILMAWLTWHTCRWSWLFVKMLPQLCRQICHDFLADLDAVQVAG